MLEENKTNCLWLLPILISLSMIFLIIGYVLTALVILIACSAIILITNLRKKFVIKPLFSAFSHTMPPLSVTEKEALESGTVWWDGQLFSGKPDWNQLLNSTLHQLTVEEQAFLDGPTEHLCEQLNDWEITHKDRDLPPHIWEFFKHGHIKGIIISLTNIFICRVI